MKNICTRLLLPKIKIPIKVNRTMKLTCALLFVASLGVYATGNAQTMRVNIQVDNVSTEKVLSEIEKQTDYLFVYNKKEVDLKRKTSVNAINKTTAEVLSTIFEGTDIIYAIEGENIMLMRKEKNLAVVPDAVQQDNKITGTVLDPTGMPVIGANIMIKGTTNGTITDVDGKFSLVVPKGATLVVTYVGYASQEITIGNQKTLSITLKEDSEALEELVVVGYGSVRKVDLAGSVDVVNSKSFKDQPVVQISDALQGRTSGVQVQRTGQPGGNLKIRIRGINSINRSNDPLYVVDGLVRESGQMGLSPDDIESIQVLKDASSTAIYGSRGSNGVILITTKKGHSGHRQISFNAQVGISDVYKKYDTLSPYEFAVAYREIKNPQAFTDEEFEGYKNGTRGIDWQDEIFKTGVTQNYKLTISNGNKDAQYYLSLNYIGEDGVVINNTNDRYQLKANISSDITKWLCVTADIEASHHVYKGCGFSRADSPLYHALNYAPTMEMFDEKGNYARDIYNSIERNPKGLLDYPGNSISTYVNGYIDLRFNILPGLVFSTTNGVNYSDAKNYNFITKKVYEYSSANNSDGYSMTLQSSNNLTYQNKWNNHSLTVTGVYEVTRNEYRSLSGVANNLLTESVGYWNLGVGETRTASNGYSQWALLSGVGRAMYNYADRYLLTATIRGDGSSKFTNNKWGWFPSVALAWNIGNEEFMQNNIFQNLKIRGSYGLVGSQAIDPYASLGLLSSKNYSWGTAVNSTGYWASLLATPDLSWEKTRQWDLGFDFSVLKQKLNVSFDYFYKKTLDGLLQKSIPDFMGGGSYWTNSGEVSNKGIDFNITANIIDAKDFSWTSTLNGSWLKNKVLSLAGEDFIYGSAAMSGTVEDVTIIKVGYPIGSFYGYRWEGLDDKGNNVYADLNGNGTLDTADREILGSSLPKFTLGWNNQVSWKNWDLNLFFNASFGAKRLNLTRFAMASMVGSTRFITLRDAYYKGFDKIGIGAEYPSLTSSTNTYLGNSSQWIEDASYLRLENISLSYNLSKAVTKFADLKLTLNCQNLFTITGYKGMDPTSSAFGSNVDVNNGIDIGAYPIPRTLTFGVQMNF